MKKIIDFDAVDTDDVDDFSEMSEEEIKSNLNSFSAAKLADIVITSRYIGLYKDLAVDAMKELADRRIAGDTFQYEDYIDNQLKDLPKIDFTFAGVQSLLDQVKILKK